MNTDDKLRLETPRWILDYVEDRCGKIDFDGACSESNRVVKDGWTLQDDNCTTEDRWHGKRWRHVWVNPPYVSSRDLLQWIIRSAVYQINTGSLQVTMLLPYDPTTKLGRVIDRLGHATATDVAFDAWVDRDDVGIAGVADVVVIRKRVRFLLDGIPTRHAAAFTSCLLSWHEPWAQQVLRICRGEK